MKHQTRSGQAPSRRTGTAAWLAALLRPRGIGAASGPPRLTFIAACASLLATTALLAGSAALATAAEICPNEQLRSENGSLGLPDCRAYELVSPTFKAGQLPIFQNYDSTTGSVYLSTLGAVGNPDSNPTAGGPTYVSHRDTSGWSATPLPLPASQFHLTGIIRALADDQSQGKLVYFQLPPYGLNPIDKQIYLQDETGAFRHVGPILPPASVAAWTPSKNSVPGDINYSGASRDLSHIFFQYSQPGDQINFLWPGDTTVRNQSLYEYVGANQTEPNLVGVDSGGQLISECGTYLGGMQTRAESESPFTGDSYNAITSDGSRFFFTVEVGGCKGRTGSNGGVVGAGPAVREIYARLGSSKTVAISEPSSNDCAACDITPAQQRDAIFQGASRDGSKVFFLSEQTLLPGAQSQSLYEYNFDAGAGERVALLATKALGVVRVSEDGTRVYFVSASVLADNQDANGGQATEGLPNLYVLQRDSQVPTGHTTYIATLASPQSEEEEETSHEECETRFRSFEFCHQLGQQVDSQDWNPVGARPVEATPDGRFLLFTSTNDLTPDASGGNPQLYRYNALSETLLRVSIGADGFNQNGNAPGNLPKFVSPAYASIAEAYAGLGSMSDDGQTIFFSSSAGLTPGAFDQACGAESAGECLYYASNIYEYHDGHISLISDGQDAHALSGETTVDLVGSTPSGGDVFFITADPLVSQDTDTQEDIYDARANGGIRAPFAAVPCQGDSCQGPSAVPPLTQSPATSAFSGVGDQGSAHRHRPKKNHSKKRDHKHPKQSGHNRGGHK